jgi:hypothetical protein
MCKSFIHYINIYRTIFLPIVLYGCVTWFLTLREEHRLWVFENRVLRKIFGPKKDQVTGKWRKLHNWELNDLYSSPSIVHVIKSRRMRWAVHVACMGARRCIYRVLLGKPEGKRPLGRLRHRWEDYIKMGLQKGGWGAGQVVGTCKCGNELWGFIKCGEFLDQLRNG